MTFFYLSLLHHNYFRSNSFCGLSQWNWLLLFNYDALDETWVKWESYFCESTENYSCKFALLSNTLTSKNLNPSCFCIFFKWGCNHLCSHVLTPMPSEVQLVRSGEACGELCIGWRRNEVNSCWRGTFSDGVRTFCGGVWTGLWMRLVATQWIPGIWILPNVHVSLLRSIYRTSLDMIVVPAVRAGVPGSKKEESTDQNLYFHRSGFSS